MNHLSTTVKQEQLTQQLKQEGLYIGENLPNAESQKTSHQLWYVRVMLGFAGWLAAIFLMGFAFICLKFFIDNAAGSIFMGSVFCVVAYALFRMTKHNDFVEQFGLAVSLAGQGILLIGLFQQFEHSMQIVFVAVFVIEVILISVMPNITHRFLSALSALLAVTLFLKEYAVHDIMLGLIAAGAVGLWLSNKWMRKPNLWTPIAYAFVCALLWFEIGRMTPLFRSVWRGDYYWWLRYAWWSGMVIEMAVLLAATTLLLKRDHISLQSKHAYCAFAASIFIGVASYFAPGISSAALVLLIGFAVGNRIVFGLGVLGLIGFLSHYYYTLHSTLLAKSAVLIILGIVLLSLRFVFLRVFTLDALKQEEHKVEVQS